MVSFYVGKYLVDESLGFDGASWALPTPNREHIEESADPWALIVLPEDIQVIPERINFGCSEWSDDESLADVDYAEFYAPPINFYVRGFTPGIDLFYPNFGTAYDDTEVYAGFYAPGVNFYVRSFTPGSDLFYPDFGKVYDDTEVFMEFYAPPIDFYLRNFSPVDFFYPLSVDDC